MRKGDSLRQNTLLSCNSLFKNESFALLWDKPSVLAQYHRTNRYEDYIERKDCLFWLVTKLFYENPLEFKSLRKKIFLEKQLYVNESGYSLTGYIRYINSEYQSARDCFIKSIALNPDNLDNWFDLAFSLRHLGEYENSEVILFHYDLVQCYYKRMIPSISKWNCFKKLLSIISKAALKEMV